MPTYEADDGALLYYDVLGESSGLPLIVLAGGAARHPKYLGDLAGLSDHYRLVIPHLRGVGRSADADILERGSWWRQAEDVDRLRASLALERCVVVAHSAGTRLAVAYAAQFPDRLAGLVLITPPAAYLVDVPYDASGLMDARMAEPAFAAAVAAETAGPDASSEDTFNAWRTATAPLGYATWGEELRARSQPGRYSMAAARAFLADKPPSDLTERLGEVLAPTLIIAGAQDVSLGVAPVVAVAQLFPEGSSVVIQQCGHHPWIEQPAAFRDAVDPFLAQTAG